MDPHEALGHLYCQFQEQLAEYRKLLDLVRRIQAGEIQPEQVEILPGDAWRLHLTMTGEDLAKSLQP